MKILSFIFFFLSVQGTFALCPGGSITMWPYSDSIGLQPIIMIEGYSYPKVIIEQVKFGTARFYLQSEGEIVELQSIEFCSGDYNLIQGIFKPKYKLKEGKKYKVTIRGLPSWQKSNFEKYWTKTWVATDVKSEVPQWTDLNFTSSYYSASFGCGDPAGYNIGVPLENVPKQMLVKVTVESVSGWYSNTYYVVANYNKIRIGSDMCSAEFELPVLDALEAEIFLLDDVGKERASRKFVLQTK